MARLSELPDDILFEISSRLPTHSLLNLRLVCRSFSALVSPIVLKDVRIVFGWASELESDEQLAERLRFYSAYFPSSHIQNLTVTTRGRATTSVTEGTVQDICERIGQSPSLHSLTLVWAQPWGAEASEAYFTIEKWQNNIIRSALKGGGGSIRSLYVQGPMNIDRLPPSLLEVRGLKVFQIRLNLFKCWGGQRFRRAAGPLSVEDADVCCIHSSVAGTVRRIIQENPALELLDVMQGCMRRPWDALGLVGESLAHLHHLEISGLRFPPTATLSPAHPFRNLRSLSVRPKYRHMPLDDLWTLLKAENVHLTKLLTTQISLPLAEYLASFSGLQDLDIRCINQHVSSTSPELISTFFGQSLPSHASSLRKLAVHFDQLAYQLPGWYYQSGIWLPALSQMPLLQSLHVYPQIPDLNPPSGDEYYEVYQSVINDLSGLQSLELLELRLFDEAYGEDIEFKANLADKTHDYVPIHKWVGQRLFSKTGRPRVVELLGVTLVRTLRPDADVDHKWRYIEETIDT